MAEKVAESDVVGQTREMFRALIEALRNDLLNSANDRQGPSCL